MKKKFVKTSNVLKFETALSALKKRGASEACWMVVYGSPGLGKTASLARFASQESAIYLRAKKRFNPSWLLDELLKIMRQDVPHKVQKRYELALQALTQRYHASLQAGGSFSLIVDEADHIVSNGDIMETLRDLSDMIELPVIMVGMSGFKQKLVRYDQITSRVSKYVEFNQATFEDVRALFDELCGVPVDDDLVKFVRMATQGFNREILEAIAIIERIGRRQAPVDRGLNMSDVAGHVIVNDRKTGEPIRAPEALSIAASA